MDYTQISEELIFQNKSADFPSQKRPLLHAWAYFLWGERCVFEKEKTKSSSYCVYTTQF